jgi:hypothetical protein
VKNCLTFRRPGALALGAWAVLAGFAVAPQVFAQSAPGRIAGTVIDPASVAVTGVQLTIRNLANDKTQTATSDAAGTYTVPNLAPGSYEVVAVKYGFREEKVRVLLVPGKRVQADLMLKLAEVAEDTAPTPDTKKIDALEDRIGELEAQVQAQDNQAAAKSAPPLLASRSMEATTLPGLPSTTPKLSAKDILLAPASPDAAPAPQAAAAPAQAPAASTQAPAAAAPPPVDNDTPFADYDWTWLNGNPRNHDVAFDSKFFTPEIRADLTYTYDFNKPIDDSMGGSSELFRSNEIQLEQLGLGGDFHVDNVRARFMSQFGLYSTATIRNDPSYNKGQWDIADADRYMAEAFGGYHINWMHGMNIDAGIFMSYIGLFSYYNFDNWAYQPSYVSSNTPWFFQGVRIQMFPTNHFKIEPWIINGWQSYASANSRKGLGGQIKYTPYPWMNFVSNNYGLGHDDLYIPNRARIHTDNSLEIRYYNRPESTGLSKMAFTFTGDLGCEFGGGVSCHGDTKGGPKQSFIGYMIYDRMWWHKDMFALTLGGGQINNPGRYLVLIPPINGETAGSAALNSPYFTGNPGDPFKAWDTSATFDYMPRQWITFRFEGDYRHASVPYWTGHGGITPPPGSNNGQPTQYACNDGTASGSTTLTPGLCSADGGVWYPDLRRDEVLFDVDLMVKF